METEKKISALRFRLNMAMHDKRRLAIYLNGLVQAIRNDTGAEPSASVLGREVDRAQALLSELYEINWPFKRPENSGLANSVDFPMKERENQPPVIGTVSGEPPAMDIDLGPSPQPVTDQAMALAEKVARLNPDAGEIGEGMLRNLVAEAREITGETE